MFFEDYENIYAKEYYERNEDFYINVDKIAHDIELSELTSSRYDYTIESI